MKKTILLLFVVLFYSSTLFSQKAVATQEQLEKFYKTKTYVVFDDDIFNTYNSAIKEAVEMHWTITEYEFLSMAEFQKKRFKSGNSFLIRTKVFSEDNPKGTSYTFLSLVLGGEYSTVNDMPDICSFPLSYYDVDYDKYDYKMPALVLFIQNHVELTKNNPKLNKTNIIRHYNKNAENITGKTLYLQKDELASNVNSVQKIKKYYSGNVKIVSAEEIHDKIVEKNANSVFLHKVGPPKGSNDKDRCYKLIIGAEDGKLYYSDYHKITIKNEDGMLKSDFKKLNK